MPGGLKFVFVWNETTGGNGANEVIHCPFVLFLLLRTGASHCTLSSDTAGHLRNELIIKVKDLDSHISKPCVFFFSFCTTFPPHDLFGGYSVQLGTFFTDLGIVAIRLIWAGFSLTSASRGCLPIRLCGTSTISPSERKD